MGTKAHSTDLRSRVVDDVAAGSSRRQAEAAVALLRSRNAVKGNGVATNRKYGHGEISLSGLTLRCFALSQHKAKSQVFLCSHRFAPA